MVVSRLARRAAHQLLAIGEDAVFVLGHLLPGAGVLRVAARFRIRRGIDVDVVRPPDAERGHLAHLLRQPAFPRALLAHPEALPAGPQPALVPVPVRELADPVLVPQARAHVAVRVRRMERELVAERLRLRDQPPERLLAAGLRADGEVARHAPVVAAVLPAGRADGQLVDARVLQRLEELLRHAERHVDGDGQLLAGLEELLRDAVGRLGDRLGGVRLDAHDDRVAEIVEFGVEPVLDRAHRAAIELVFAVGVRKAVVVRLRAVEAAEVHDDVVVVFGEEHAHPLAVEARVRLVRALLRLRHERVREAPCLDVPVPERTALLHAEDRHELGRPHVDAVVLVEETVRAARLHPVAVVVLLRREEARHHLHVLRVLGDLRLRHHETPGRVAGLLQINRARLVAHALGSLRVADAYGCRLRPSRQGERRNKRRRKHPNVHLVFSVVIIFLSARPPCGRRVTLRGGSTPEGTPRSQPSA